MACTYFPPGNVWVTCDRMDERRYIRGQEEYHTGTSWIQEIYLSRTEETALNNAKTSMEFRMSANVLVWLETWQADVHVVSRVGSIFFTIRFQCTREENEGWISKGQEPTYGNTWYGALGIVVIFRLDRRMKCNRLLEMHWFSLHKEMINTESL